MVLARARGARVVGGALMPVKWIAFKDSCRVTPGSLRLAAELLFLAAECAPELHGDTLIVTSLADGTEHKPGSMHYAGAAVDVRTHPNDDGSPRIGAIVGDVDATAARWATAIRKRAGSGRQAMYERERKHLHIELDLEGE